MWKPIIWTGKIFQIITVLLSSSLCTGLFVPINNTIVDLRILNTMNMKMHTYDLLAALFIILATGGISSVCAKPLAPPNDPNQSITYWKPYTIPAAKDPLVAQTQEVFAVLLRAWNSSHLEPSLYVVNSAAGPWAASLADGNILLSRAAIETCMSFGKDRAEHLLAFILAHELAHQRSDDLWHQRFFRLIGNHAPDIKQKMLQGLQLNGQLWTDVAQKEAQADYDSLIMMSSEGYDPYQILDKRIFSPRGWKIFGGIPAN